MNKIIDNYYKITIKILEAHQSTSFTTYTKNIKILKYFRRINFYYRLKV